jgi:hypothetical protein
MTGARLSSTCPGSCGCVTFDLMALAARERLG